MFIKLTQIYRAKAEDTGGDLFVNPDHIISMQTGLLINGVKATALTVTLEGYLYVAETPEQITARIEGDDEKAPASTFPANFGHFSIHDLVEAAGGEWIKCPVNEMYFVMHAKIPLAGGKILYLRQGDAPDDRECCLVDEQGFEPYEGPALPAKFKVQVRSINGWADLKASVDGGPYLVELFDSAHEARADVGDEMSADEYRIVPDDTPADDDLY
jgi:hypothetical protein